jgi:hypothetical protein
MSLLLEACVALTEGDGTTLLDEVHSLLRAPDASSPNPSTTYGRENPDVPKSLHVAEQVQEDIGAAVHVSDMEVFSISYVSKVIAKQLLCGVGCDVCKACLISQVLISTNVFVYFKYWVGA